MCVYDDGNAPQEPTDESQAYFWTPEWQAGEQEAEEDIAAGRVYEFDNVDDLIASLHAYRKKARAKSRSMKVSG
jgi:hypothetical protein